MSSKKIVKFNEIAVNEAVAQLRSQLSDEINNLTPDDMCERFLIARKLDLQQAKDLLEKCWIWRNSELPGTESGITPQNILARTKSNNISFHSEKDIVPHALFGFGKEGYPIYWEQTGVIGENFDKARKNWTVDDLLQMHVRTQELMRTRAKFISDKIGKRVDQNIVVFNLKNLPITPDFECITYIRRLLAIDQVFYPETLNKLFVINAPWYFSAIFALIKPFIDTDTALKISILGSDYMPQLLEFVDEDNIPVEMGGRCDNVPWSGPWTDECGCSEDQVDFFSSSK